MFESDLLAFISPASLTLSLLIKSFFFGLSASFRNNAQFSNFEFVSIDFYNSISTIKCEIV